MRTRAILSIGLAASIGAGAARAQVSSSPSFALSSGEFVAAVAGASSPGAASPARAAYGALGSAVPGETASATAQAFSSFLHAFDPFGGSGPVVFEVVPPQGPTGGGTAVQLRGARFLPTGAAVFGLAGVATSATSPTRTLAMSPASGSPIPAGPVVLVVGDAGGVAIVPGGFRYLPAVLGSNGVLPGNDVLVRHFGPAGNAFSFALSLGTIPPSPIPGIAGFLQLDPVAPFLIFVIPSFYQADGTRPVAIPTPPDPALSGTTVYWQSVVHPPTPPQFSNLGSTSFL